MSLAPIGSDASVVWFYGTTNGDGTLRFAENDPDFNGGLEACWDVFQRNTACN